MNSYRKMRVFLSVLIILLFICSVNSRAGVRQIVFLEEATNASCPPCAANNPKLQEFVSGYFGGVVSLRYHAWWPVDNDPMYHENESNNNKRINYYGITGVPHYLMNGEDMGVPNDPVGMAMTLKKLLFDPAPVEIQIDARITADSVLVTLILIGHESINEKMFLRSAIIERMVTYTSPPGNNGEKIFPDVMRKLIPSSRGYSIASVASGDTLVYYLDDPVESWWNWQDLAVVAWLQSDDTQEIVQSNISLPTYIIESSESSADILEGERSYSKSFLIHNDNRDTLHLEITAEAVHISPEWSFTLKHGDRPADSLIVAVLPGDSVAFSLEIETGPDAEWMKIKLFARNTDDPYGYGYTQEYVGLVPQGDVLFVDDDGGEEYESLYHTAFEERGIPVTSIPEPDLISLSDQLDVNRYAALFWNVSWGFPAFVPEDIALLKSYLDGGGNLFLAGQDIAWDIFYAYGSSHFTEARNFFTEYLHASYLGDDAGGSLIEGTPGDPISDGLSIQLNSVYTRSPDWISSQTGLSVPLFRFAENNHIAGVKYDGQTYRAVYLPFGLEQISDRQTAHIIVDRTLTWFQERTTGIESVSGTGLSGTPSSCPPPLTL